MNNTKPQMTIFDCNTGEVVIRDANAAELAQMQLDADNAQAAQVKAEAQASAKAELLARLGITADEAKLLLS